MNPYEKLKAARGGQFVAVVWQRACKVKKGAPAIQKRCAANGLTFGVNYDNRGVVVAGREDGTLPAENAGLIGRTWVEFPRFLKSDKSGAMMARFNVTKSSRFATQFLLNGKRVELEKVKEFLYASEYAKREDFTTFDLTIDNICAVRA
jgi:hypothetical protein